MYSNPTASTSSTLGATISIRTYFSSSHLWAAKHFTRLAAGIENLSSTDLYAEAGVEHRAYVTNAILSSVAFIEGAINEICKDVVDGHESYIEPLDELSRTRISVMWDLTEAKNRSGSILDKYQNVLTYCSKEKFDKKHELYKGAELVISLRNELMHYKPSTYSGENQHNFIERLSGKFEENSFRVSSGNPYFPDKCLGSPCAKWAIKSTKNLADEFFNRLNITPPYQRE